MTFFLSDLRFYGDKQNGHHFEQILLYTGKLRINAIFLLNNDIILILAEASSVNTILHSWQKTLVFFLTSEKKNSFEKTPIKSRKRHLLIERDMLHP